MTLDTYLPKYELKYYLTKEGLTRYQVQHEVLMHYILEHDILLNENNPEILLYDIMYWDLKWYESQSQYEYCQVLKDTMDNIGRLLKDK